MTSKTSFMNIKHNAFPSSTTFTISPIHVSYANTIRRLILTHVETVAFRCDIRSDGKTGDIIVHKNGTPMTNEMFAHRISLIPLHVPNPLLWKSEKYSFNLDEQESSIKDSVFASDFKVFERNDVSGDLKQISSDLFFKPDPISKSTCLITTFQPNTNQAVRVDAIATIGNGKENANFIPVSQCSYKYSKDADPEKIKNTFQKWILESKKIDNLVDGSDLHKLLYREFETMEIERCFITDEKGEPNSFDFTIESIGVLSVPYIVNRALEIGEMLVGRYVSIDKEEAMPEDLSITPTDSKLIGFDFLFKGHDHTLGNLLQTWLVENHIDGSSMPRITFAGYNVPHPLYAEMVLRIGVEDGEEKTARQAVAEACRGIVSMFHELRDSWKQETEGRQQPSAKRRLVIKK